MKNILKEVIEIVKNAGSEVLKIYHQNYAIHKKQNKSPVTEADLISNKIIIKGLRKYGWPILSEESGDDLSRLKKEKVWIIDPLDGTKDFIQKTGEFSIMVALVKNGVSVLGIVYKPVGDKFYYALKNQGAFRKRKGRTKKLSVSNINKLSESIAVISRNHFRKEDAEIVKKLGISKMIKAGSVGVKIGLIAEKKAHIYFNASDKTCEWDTAAPQIILEEAGGKMTDINNEALRYNKKIVFNLNGILATNNKNHAKIAKAF